MSVINKFTFLDANDVILGVCYIDDITPLSDKQYLLEDYILYQGNGYNPRNINSPYYQGMSFDTTLLTESEISDLLNKGVILPTDINPEYSKKIYRGIHINVLSSGAGGEYYFIKVPFLTAKITSDNFEINLSDFPSIEYIKSDTILMLTSNGDDLLFDAGIITTRSYLIDPNDISTGSYLPEYLSKLFENNLLINSDNNFIQLPGTDKIYIKTLTENPTVVNSYYKEGDTKEIDGVTFRCVQDTDSENFDNATYWVQI